MNSAMTAADRRRSDPAASARNGCASSCAFGEEQLLALVDRQHDASAASGFARVERRGALPCRSDACRSGLSFVSAALDGCPQIGARDREACGRERAFQRPQQTGLAGRSRRAPAGRSAAAGNAGRSRASRGQRPARRNDDLPAPDAPRITNRRGARSFAQAAQLIERLDDRRIAAEEDAGVLGFQRAQAPIRRTLRIVLAAAN